MRVPSKLSPEAEQIALWLSTGKRDEAREALNDAPARIVLDTVYAFLKYTTKTENWVTAPADPTDPATLAEAFHVIRNMTELCL